MHGLRHRSSSAGALRRSVSLHGATIVFVAAVCLLLVALDLSQSRSAYNTRLRGAQTETDNLARSLAQHIGDMFDTANASLMVLRDAYGAEGPERSTLASLERWMRVRVASQKLMHGIFIVDEHGDWVASALTPEMAAPLRSLNYASRPFFQWHRDHPGDDLLIGAPLRTQHDSLWVVTISRRLYHHDGSFAGVIATSISLNLLQDFFESFSIGEHGSITLTSRQGSIVARRPYVEDVIGRNLAQAGFFQTTRDDFASGSLEFVSAVDGRERLGSFQRIPGLDLIVFVALDRNEVLATWWAAVQFRFLVLAAAVLTVAGLGYVLSLQIRRRMRAEQLLSESHRTLERRVAERTADLEVARDRAEQASTAKTAFLNMVSHELRTPLTQLVLQLELLHRSFRETMSPRQGQALANTSSAVNRLTRLIGSVLEYSRIKSERLEVRPSRFNLCELVAKACADVQHDAAHRGLELQFEAEAGLPLLLSDPTLVSVIVHNLLDNAIKYTPAGRISAQVKTNGDHMAIEIADTGPGIPADFQARMFEPFEQAEEVDRKHRVGVGLGLALVNEITRVLGGRITVDSVAGQGSRFLIQLPIVAEQSVSQEFEHAFDTRHRG